MNYHHPDDVKLLQDLIEAYTRHRPQDYDARESLHLQVLERLFTLRGVAIAAVKVERAKTARIVEAAVLIDGLCEKFIASWVVATTRTPTRSAPSASSRSPSFPPFARQDSWAMARATR